MSEQTITIEQISVKPCIKCGAMDRKKSGACRPCARENSRKWSNANRQKCVEYVRKWRMANLEKAAKYQRQWRNVNTEKHNKYAREWSNANPQKCKAYRHNRKARVKGNGGKLSPDIIKTLMALQKGKCACCGKNLKDGYHLDHIMPIALGGTNTDDNVQLLTPSCNLRKSAKHPDDWARESSRT